MHAKRMKNQNRSKSVEFMHRAIELSREHMHAGQGGPFGAVIVKDGKIVAEGWNCVFRLRRPAVSVRFRPAIGA